MNPFMRINHLKLPIPAAPLSVWLLALSLVMAFGTGKGVHSFLQTFNAGFGRALGEFALILLPSFVLAAVMAKQHVTSSGRLPELAAPLAGAGMVCPDTAYAALSPIAGRHKLGVAMGAYAGFKLLFPAGPLIVATGLGVGQENLLWYSVLVFLPVWGVGLLWAHWMGGEHAASPVDTVPAQPGALGRMLAPFGLMALLLVLGQVWNSGLVWIDYLTLPKGALMAAAVLALWLAPAGTQRECMDSALRRTGALLLVIGMASACGAVLIDTGALDSWALSGSGWHALLSLFLLTALFKMVQGSSMATFAAITPVASAFLATNPLPAAAAVLVICAGSFVAILPNDSFYWLVRRDALERAPEWRSVSVLAGGALLQALMALAMVWLVVGSGD